MEENQKKFSWKTAVIIVMTCFIIFGFIKINDMSNEISHLQSTLSGYQNQLWSLNNEIAYIYDNVDKTLKKEASLLSSVDYTLGELNTETNTVPLTLRVVPKDLTEDMKLSVKVGNETAILERNGNEFFATIDVNLFISDLPMLSITTGETTKTEKLDDVETDHLFTRYLPYIYAHLESSDTLKNGKLTIDGLLIFDEKPVSMNGGTTVTKLELVTVKNGQEIDRKNLTAGINPQNHHIPVNTSYDAEYGDKFCIYVLAEDSLGYTHKALAYFWNDLDEHTHHAITAVDGGVQIYDKNGNLLINNY